MERTFTVEEAKAMLDEARPVIADVIETRAALATRLHALQLGERSELPEVKGLEARLSELLDWFVTRGVQLKGYAPLLLDWPMRRGDEVILLCWLENEPELAWYHDAELGFMGRRPVGELG